MWSEKDPNHLLVKNANTLENTNKNTYSHGIGSSTTATAGGITSSGG